MRSLLHLALLAGLLVSACFVSAQDGFDGGRWVIVEFDKGTISNPLQDLDPYHLHVFAPQTCSSQCGPWVLGNFPVLIFATGFAGSVPAADYSTVLQGIAKHGIVVVAVDTVSQLTVTVDYGRMAQPIAFVVNYVKTKLNDDLVANGANKGILTSKFFFGGHSSGNHIVGQYIKSLTASAQDCSVAGGFVMINPLDGQDPLGFGGADLILPGETLPFTTPALMITGTLDPVDTAAFPGAACGPLNRGAFHFYGGWQGSAYLIEATGMGHLDVIDESTTTRYDAYCARSNATDDQLRTDYRVMVRGAVVEFITGVASVNPASFDKLGSQADLKFPVTKTEHKVQSNSFGCLYSPPPPAVNNEYQTGMALFGVMFAIVFVCGLCCFFRKMDDDTLHKYEGSYAAEFGGHDSFKSVQQMPGNSVQSRATSVNV